MQNSSCKLPSGMTFPNITNWYTPKKNASWTSAFDSLTSPISPPPFFPLFPTMFHPSAQGFFFCLQSPRCPATQAHPLGTSVPLLCAGHFTAVQLPVKNLRISQPNIAPQHSTHPNKNSPKLAAIYGIFTRIKYVKPVDTSTFTTIKSL